eukprot:s8465_g3.t1
MGRHGSVSGLSEDGNEGECGPFWVFRLLEAPHDPLDAFDEEHTQPGGDLPRCQREALRLLRELPSGKATGADIMEILSESSATEHLRHQGLSVVPRVELEKDAVAAPWSSDYRKAVRSAVKHYCPKIVMACWDLMSATPPDTLSTAREMVQSDFAADIAMTQVKET